MMEFRILPLLRYLVTPLITYSCCWAEEMEHFPAVLLPRMFISLRLPLELLIIMEMQAYLCSLSRPQDQRLFKCLQEVGMAPLPADQLRVCLKVARCRSLMILIMTEILISPALRLK